MGATVFVSAQDMLVDRLMQLSKAIDGETNKAELAEAICRAIGFAVLSDVHQAFVTKARGGTDALGIKWKPLSPKTIARRRVGPRDKKANPEIGKRERWVKKRTKELIPKYEMAHPRKKAEKIARAVAEHEYTRSSGKTKLSLLSKRSVEILRDTGVLLNSLTPGQLVVGPGIHDYSAPPLEGGTQQVFIVRPGSVTIGTKVEYADQHQYGTKRIPARPFLPPDEQRELPSQWVDNAKDAIQQALIAMLPKYFGK